MEKLPDFLRKYFWDIDFEKLNPGKRTVYILKRILEYGDEQAVVWMKEHYSKKEITEVLLSSRGLSRKTCNYWAVVLGLSEKERTCMNRPLFKGLEIIWKY